MRNLLVIAGTALLALGIALSSWSGVVNSSDHDGVPDPVDNCVLVPNGFALATGSCDDQEDGDSDGFGNPCDTDTNNDGATGLDDVNATLVAAIAVSTVNEYDYNCDGAAGLDDVNRALIDAITVATPGPSGYACAGIVPCP